MVDKNANVVYNLDSSVSFHAYWCTAYKRISKKNTILKGGPDMWVPFLTVAVLAPFLFLFIRERRKHKQTKLKLRSKNHHFTAAQRKIELMQKRAATHRKFSDLALLDREIQDQGHEFSTDVLAKISKVIGSFRVMVTIGDRTIFDTSIYPPGMDATLHLGFDYKSTQIYVEKPEDNGQLLKIASLAIAINSWAEKTHLSMTDELTGLYNRRYWRRKVKDEMTRAKRYGHKLSIVMVDIDHFKSINDNYGHSAGDKALTELSNLFLGIIRKQIDMVARWGGDELSLLLPETNKEEAKVMAEKIRLAVESYPFYDDDGKGIKLTVSVGVATFPDSASDFKELRKRADDALYISKDAGRNVVTLAPVTTL